MGIFYSDTFYEPRFAQHVSKMLQQERAQVCNNECTLVLVLCPHVYISPLPSLFHGRRRLAVCVCDISSSSEALHEGERASHTHIHTPLSPYLIGVKLDVAVGASCR